MSRNNKKTRIKGTPPRLQLQQIDAATGSYPTNVRLSTDGRTGKYKISYDDQRTIVYSNSVVSGGWQANLVAYWTMQRALSNTGASASVVFPSEIPGTISDSQYPFLDLNGSDFGVDEVYIVEYGVSESFPQGRKAYDVSIDEHRTTGNSVFPTTSSVRNYKFEPKFSLYHKMNSAAQVFGFTTPILTQDIDSDKSVCAFDGNWVEGPQPFTIAGWFRFNDLSNSQNFNSLILGPSRNGDLFSKSNRDYDIQVVSTGSNNGSHAISLTLTSGSSYETVVTEYFTNSSFYDRWFHLAVTYNGATNRTVVNPRGDFGLGSVNVYLDGEPLEVTHGFSFGNFNGFVSGTSPNYGISLFQTEIDSGISLTGSLGEIAFFNKVLSPQEVKEIYTCRVPLHKKNKVIAGTSITLNNDPNPIESSEHITSFDGDGMLTVGSVVKGVGDVGEWLHFTPGQEMRPFNDSNHPAVDGKSQNNPFYATGSLVKNIGEGFTSPLWSKNKIEIELNTTADITLGGNLGPDTVADDRYMAYYDHGLKAWTKIGSSTKATTYYSSSAAAGTAVSQYFGEKAIGFPHSLIYTNASPNSDVTNIPRIGREFGFPFAEKYSVASTSSILYPLSGTIDQPFLLEKIVLEFSGTYTNADFNTQWGAGAVGIAANNFFILNQKTGIRIKPQVVTLVPGASSLPVNVTQSLNVTSSNYVDFVSSLCVATPGFSESMWYTQVTDSNSRTNVLAPVLENNSNLNFIFSFDQFGNYWSGRYVVSGACVSPIENNDPDLNLPIRFRTGSVGEEYITGISSYGNRQNVNKLSDPRSYRNPGAGYSTTPLYDATFASIVKTNAQAMTVNPYVLYPTDKLIFGWQAPFNGFYYERQTPDGVTIKIGTSGSIMPNLTIAAGPSKVILYGSYIKNGQESNDGTNQLLSSNAVHEVIE